MTFKMIRNEAEYNAALAEIDRLMDGESGTSEGVELEALVSLVEVYEAAHWPVDGSATLDELHQRFTRRPSVSPSVSPAEIVRRERDSR